MVFYTRDAAIDMEAYQAKRRELLARLQAHMLGNGAFAISWCALRHGWAYGSSYEGEFAKAADFLHTALTGDDITLSPAAVRMVENIRYPGSLISNQCLDAMLAYITERIDLLRQAAPYDYDDMLLRETGATCIDESIGELQRMHEHVALKQAQIDLSLVKKVAEQ